MFRDIVFVCFDYSFRVLDGYFIFRWWRTYVPKDVSEGKYTIRSDNSTSFVSIIIYEFPPFRSITF